MEIHKNILNPKNVNSHVQMNQGECSIILRNIVDDYQPLEINLQMMPTLRISVLSLTTYLRSKKVPLLSFEWLLWNSKAANHPDSRDLIGLYLYRMVIIFEAHMSGGKMVHCRK